MTSDEIVLVTGAGGFVGLHLVKRLCRDGARVRAMVRRAEDEAKFEGLEGTPVECVVGDLRNADDTAAAVSGVSTIFHLAAATAGGVHDQLEGSYNGTKNLLDAARQEPQVRKLIYTSTVSVLAQTEYPSTGSIPDDFKLEEHAVRRGAYAYSKLKTEQLLIQYREQVDFPMVIVRPGLIWGAGKDQLAMDTSIALGSRVLVVLGSGKKQQPLVHVESVVDALVRCQGLDNPPAQAMTLVDDENPTQREYLRHLNAVTGSRYLPLFIPAILLRPIAWFGDKVLTRILGMNPYIQYKFKSKESTAIYSAELAKQTLGWSGTPGFLSRLQTDYSSR